VNPPCAVESGSNSGKDSGSGRPPPFVADVEIRIDRNGQWHYQGSPIPRKELVCLFASVLRRDEDGEYWLETPVERRRITVEDAPFMAVEMFTDHGGQDQVISFRTNIDEIVALGSDNPLRVETNPDTGEPAPYVLVRPGLEAKVTRSVFYEMVALGLEETVAGEDIFGLWSNRTFIRWASWTTAREAGRRGRAVRRGRRTRPAARDEIQRHRIRPPGTAALGDTVGPRRQPAEPRLHPGREQAADPGGGAGAAGRPPGRPDHAADPADRPPGTPSGPG